MPSYYKVLGVAPTATAEELKAAFRKKAVRYHPDKGKYKDGQKFTELNAAYEVLRDPNKRATYDKELANPSALKKRNVRTVKADIHGTIVLNAYEQLFGLVRKITLNYQMGTRVKTKTLNVRIPRGLFEGQILRLAGQGIHGGDIYLTIKLVA